MRVIVLALFLFVPHSVWAEWVVATGAQVFPPSIAEDLACQKADDLARMDAVRQVVGETLWAQDWMQCRESDDQNNCQHNAAIWVDLGGTIRTVRHRSLQTNDEMAGYRRCVVRLEADVIVATHHADPNFTLGVDLNTAVFRDGDNMVLTLSPSQPMSVQVFLWLPYEKSPLQVQRLFPNPYQGEGHIQQALTLPGPGYSLKVSSPMDGNRVVDEYLLVIASRKPLSLRNSYTLDEFSHLVSELPPQDSRLVRRAYTIVRGP